MTNINASIKKIIGYVQNRGVEFDGDLPDIMIMQKLNCINACN